MRYFFSILFFFAIVLCIHAQQDVQTAKADTARTAEPHWVPNPTIAALLSAALPGAGQVYSRNYLHSVIFVAAESYCAWRVIDAAQRTEELWDKRSGIDTDSPEYAAARSEFEYSANERNTYLWFLAGAKFLDIADAYISAHLYDFDERMNAPVSIAIIPRRGGAEVCLNFHF